MVRKLQLSIIYTKDTRSTTHFNLLPSFYRRHFNFVSVVNGIKTESYWIYVERNWLYIFISVEASSMYVQYKLNISGNQVDTLKDAIRLKKGVTLCFPKGGIRGRLDKTQAEGRGV